MRGQRKKRAEEEKEAEEVGEGVEVIDVSEHQPRRIPSNSRPKGDRPPEEAATKRSGVANARSHQESLGS